VVETPVVEAGVLRPLTAYAGLVVGGLRAARRWRPDVVYAREMLGPAPLLLARTLGVPLVIEVNGDAYAHRRAALGHGSVRLAVARALQRLSFRGASRIVAVTAGLRASLVARFGVAPEHVTVVGNGTNLQRLRPMDAAACRRALGLPETAPYVGFVGTFFVHQGISTLIDAAAAVLAARPGTRFLIVGDGPAAEAWRRQVGDKGLTRAFHFPGQVDHARVATWINAMDVCVAPFTGERGETSPLKLFDYFACGRPAVVSAIDPVAHVVRESNACVAVPPDDAPALAAAVAELLADEAWRRRLGDAGRAWVAAHHGWDTVARRVLDVCDAARRARRERG
jgi:glycosyltransferase involved in cell wall biosynthesis